jgi:hypothetical protein
MSSVSDVVNCEQCGGLAHAEFQTRDQTYSVVCPLCGYTNYTVALIDRKKQKEDPEHREWFLKTMDGKLIHRTYVRKGNGAYFTKARKGCGSMGVITVPMTQEIIDDFREWMRLNAEELDLDACYLTRWNEVLKEVEMVIGTNDALIDVNSVA